MTLITLEREEDVLAAGLTYAQELAELEPSNPQVRALIDDLRQRRGR